MGFFDLFEHSGEKDADFPIKVGNDEAVGFPWVLGEAVATKEFLHELEQICFNLL